MSSAIDAAKDCYGRILKEKGFDFTLALMIVLEWSESEIKQVLGVTEYKKMTKDEAREIVK